MSPEVFAGLNQQAPLGGIMGNYPLAFEIELLLLTLVAIAIVAILLSIPQKPRRETQTEQKSGEPQKEKEILICLYCKTRNSPSAKFCKTCGANLEQ
jgi:uncharacterized paraquat-inducible protein A